MIQRRFFVAALLAAFIASTVVAVQAQAPAAAKSGTANSRSAIPRTPDGKPDFQGSWTTETYTPFERPNEFKDRAFFSEAEAAAYAKRALERAQAQAPDDIHYDNNIWMSEGTPKGLTSLRTSIVDTPDGKMPPVNAEGRRRAADRQAARRGIDPFQSAQTRSISERCIYWGHEGPPLLPTGYNNNLQIVQSPGDVAIIPEMMGIARVAKLGDPYVSAVLRTIRGTSRAHWDGDTLVIESGNFNDLAPFRGSSPNLKVTERLTMIDKDTIRYQFTIDDPQTWDVKWGGEYPIRRTGYPMIEYACHEGNYGLRNILSAKRAEEREAKEAVRKAGTQ
jgi:hypothetical protein